MSITRRLSLIFACLLLGVTLASAEEGVSPISPTSNGGRAIAPVIVETGFISISVDGLGTLDDSGVIQVEKPDGATVRQAYFAAASTGFTGYEISDGELQINGEGVTWDTATANSISSWNYWADVTDIVQPVVDAAPAGLVDFTITETGDSFLVDGELLAVIFDDPNQTSANTIILLFGAQETTGDTFAIGLLEPLDLSDPNLQLDLGLGISYSFQDNGTQFSEIDVNGVRMTSSAGGYDDGDAANGALFTVGGLDDATTNPPDPFAPPTSDNRYDDELYSLIPFVNDGDEIITVDTLNPSNDDNILFAYLVLNATTAVVGEGIALGPDGQTICLGEEVTLEALVQDDDGNPLADEEITFEVTAGPHTGEMDVQMSDANGEATFVYTGSVAGVDTVVASFLSGSDTLFSNAVSVTWEDCPPTDVALIGFEGQNAPQAGRWIIWLAIALTAGGAYFALRYRRAWRRFG